MIRKLAEADFWTKYGVVKEYLYYDGQKESTAWGMITIWVSQSRAPKRWSSKE